jgi:VanZ family protein
MVFWVGAWLMVIFLASSIPDLRALDPLGWWERSHRFVIQQIPWERVFSWDNPFFHIPSYGSIDTIVHKMGHVIVYSVLGWLCGRAMRNKKRALLLCASYALLDELHQALVPGRSSRLMDVLLDILAAATFITLTRSVWKQKKHLPSPPA